MDSSPANNLLAAEMAAVFNRARFVSLHRALSAIVDGMGPADARLRRIGDVLAAHPIDPMESHMTNMPRGVRNNNPGNVRHGPAWDGLAEDQADGAFATFVSPTHGIRALCRTLLTYRRKYGLRTVRDIIARWAPPTENATGAYALHVAMALDVGVGDPIDVEDPGVLQALAEAIIHHENGAPASTWYQAETIRRGVELALA